MEKKEQLMIQSIQHVSNMVEVVLWHGHVCKTSKGTDLLVFHNAARRSRKANSETHTYVLCSHSVKCNETDRTALHSADG